MRRRKGTIQTQTTRAVMVPVQKHKGTPGNTEESKQAHLSCSRLCRCLSGKSVNQRISCTKVPTAEERGQLSVALDWWVITFSGEGRNNLLMEKKARKH